MNLFCLAYCCTFSLSFFCSSTQEYATKKDRKKGNNMQRKKNGLVPAGRPGTPGTKGPRSRD